MSIGTVGKFAFGFLGEVCVRPVCRGRDRETRSTRFLGATAVIDVRLAFYESSSSTGDLPIFLRAVFQPSGTRSSLCMSYVSGSIATQREGTSGLNPNFRIRSTTTGNDRGKGALSAGARLLAGCSPTTSHSYTTSTPIAETEKTYFAE